MKGTLWLSEAMQKFNIKLERGYINVINGLCGGGKTHFIKKELLRNPHKYCDIEKLARNNVLYVCDINMLKQSIAKNNDFKYYSERDIKYNFKTLFKRDMGKKIPVLCYATFNTILRDKELRNKIYSTFECIILDELHNLFKFNCSFKGEYQSVINHLNKLSKNILTIGLTATPQPIYEKINAKLLFSEEQLQMIRHYEGKEMPINDIMSAIKTFDWLGMKRDGKKAIIYTKKITEQEKFKEFFLEYFEDIKVENIFSPNRGCVVDIETGEIIADKPTYPLKEGTEFIPDMTEEQLEIRSYLLEKEQMPDDLDILIINSAYTTGWNLKDENVQYVFTNTTDEIDAYQSRNRVRADIELWFMLNHEESIELRIEEIDERFLNHKLSSEEKKEMVELYGIKKLDSKSKPSFQSLKKQLEEMGYIVTCNKNGIIVTKPIDIKAYLEPLIGIKLVGEQKKQLQFTLGEKKIEAINSKIKDLGFEVISDRTESARYWVVIYR